MSIRTLLTGATALALLAMPAAAQDTALPEDAVAHGVSVEAMGAAPEPLRIAVLSYQGSSFWQAVDGGIEAAQAYLEPLNTTVDYIQLGTTLSAEVLVAGIDGALAQQYDGIVTIPIFDGTVAKVNEAVAAGVPVISFIADSAERSDRVAGLGTLAYDAGAKAGAFIAEHMGGEGKMAVITGYLGAAQHDARMNGALDYIRENYPGIEIIGPFECRDDDATAYGQATDVMTSNADLEVIYVTAGGSEAAAKAVRDAGMTGQVGVVGYDDLPEKAQYKEGGEILALLDQAPYRQAFDAIVMMHNILAFDASYPEDVPIDSPLVLGAGAAE